MPSSAPSTTICPVGTTLTMVDFSTSKDGSTNYSHGDYVKNLGYGFVLAVQPGPGAKKRPRRPRIYDSSIEGGADADLEAAGEGNLLIIQERGKQVDDNELGGAIIFKFDQPTDIISIGLVDTEEKTVLVFRSTSGTEKVIAPRIANGTAQTVEVNQSDVDKLKVKFAGSAGISHIEICCPDDDL